VRQETKDSGRAAGGARDGRREGPARGGEPRRRGRAAHLAEWARQGGGKLRRIFLVHFARRYVRSQLSLRKGECSQCGCCCHFAFPCAHLTRQGLCRVYDGRRWLVCRVFPIDRRDLEDVARAGGRCGYHWD